MGAGSDAMTEPEARTQVFRDYKTSTRPLWYSTTPSTLEYIIRFEARENMLGIGNSKVTLLNNA